MIAISYFDEAIFCLSKRFFQPDNFHSPKDKDLSLEYIDISPSLKIVSPLKNLPAAAESHGFPLDIDRLPTDIDTLPPDIGRLPTDIDTFPPDIDGLPSDIDTFPPDIDRLPTDIDTLPPDIDGLPTDIDTFPPDIDRLPTDIDTFPPDIDRLPTDIDRLPTDIDTLPSDNPPARVESNKSSNVNEKRRFKNGLLDKKTNGNSSEKRKKSNHQCPRLPGY